MTAKPTAVVVRLPLSDAQKTCFYSRHYTGDPTPGLIAIGTPVAGGELEYCAQIVWHDDAVEPEVAAWRNKDIKKGASIKVVRQSDAQAALAAAQAENMRLRDHLETVRSYLKEAPSVTARRGALDVIEEALKGPAA
ncbi:hypothetical protein [Acetobacter sp. P5B1]|uniref:hypothetical protein n=1 Tax=Acetobacter sp. P5B1 TaxID=2762620 RepID=UPI001C052F4E|nr:hypothetical protein [Acetobacter sp. P5B1]